MTTRWWAPTRPTIDPDAVVKALLKPDGDPAGDLGATLLGLHRAGAAACETVAKGAVPSEAGLIRAMSSARERVAGPVVDAASASMEPTYAGLFVRDFFDDAEAGAVSLYRTAISKGVSSPIAVERAAAVYGVPAKQFGKYAAMATDPKANLTALTDAADRCLLAYISKTVASETAETVSKATTTALDFDDDEHPRGAMGRFVTTAPKVDTEPVAPVKRERQQRVQRKQRVTRQQRSQRVQRSQPSTEPQTRTQVAHTRVNQPSRQPTRRERIINTVVNTFNKPNKPGTDLEPWVGPIPDLLKPFDTGKQTYYELPYTLVFSASEKVTNELMLKAREQAGGQRDPSTLIFRIGHLLNKAGNPDLEIAGGPAAMKVLLQADQVRRLGDVYTHPGGAEIQTAEPEVRYIHPDEMNQQIDEAGALRSEAAFREWVESQRRAEFTHTQRKPDGSTQEYEDKNENEFVEVYNEYRKLGPGNENAPRGIAIVHWKPINDDDYNNRPKPVTTEFVIASDAVGYEEGSGNDVNKYHFKLNPNTVYKVVHPPFHSETSVVGPEVMFDPEREVVVNRYYIRAIDDEEVGDIISKATDFEEEHPRGEHGQWIASAERPSTVAKPVLPTHAPEQKQREQRVPREQRQQRSQRVQRSEPAKPEITSVSRRLIHTKQVERQAHTLVNRPLLHAIQHRMAAIPSNSGVLPPLSDSSAYRVFTQHEFTDITDTISDDDYTKMIGGETITLNSVARSRILTAKDRRVESLSEHMRYNTEVELSAHNREVISKPIGDMTMPHWQDQDAIADKVGALFAKFKSLDQVEMVRRGQKLYFYGNSTPASPQILLQLDLDLDIDKPMAMKYEGEHRAHEVKTLVKDKLPETLVDIGFNTADTTVTSPQIQIFKVTNPVVRRYTVNNP